MKFISILSFSLSSLFLLNIGYTQTIKKWEVVDLKFKSPPTKNVNPHNTALSASFKHESGELISIPGFYDGENNWIIRFCPPKEGVWQYATESGNKKLNGQNGSLTVIETSKDQHGPIKIASDNVKRFAYADDTPYHLMAYELDWLFALDWDNKDDIPNTKQIIDKIAANGFNQVVMNVYAYDANWGERDKINPRHNFARPKVFPYGGTNETPNFDELNIDFFQHLDRVVAYLNEKSIVAHLMIYVWNKKVNWPEPRSEQDNRYFDYVVKRYQAYPNLIWDISKEALAYGRDDLTYITDRIDRLRKMDGHKRLLSVHDYKYCSTFPEKVDFISIQEWVPNLYNAMLNAAEVSSDKPVFNIEHGGYDRTMHTIFGGAYDDALTCLWRNYECLFAGTYSTYYWQNTSWYEVIYDMDNLPEQKQPRLGWYNQLVNIMEKYHFERMEPVQGVFTPYALHDKKDKLVLLLMPENRNQVSGELSFLANKALSISWVNPLTGEVFEGQKREENYGAWLGFDRDKRVLSPFTIAVVKYD